MKTCVLSPCTQGMAAVFRVGLALLQCDSSQLLNMDIETMLKVLLCVCLS